MMPGPFSRAGNSTQQEWLYYADLGMILSPSFTVCIPS